jgi:hypothetical protein
VRTAVFVAQRVITGRWHATSAPADYIQALPVHRAYLATVRASEAAPGPPYLPGIGPAAGMKVSVIPGSTRCLAYDPLHDVTVLVAGASGATGQLLVKQLLDRGLKVKASTEA